MKKQELICIRCPVGCPLTVSVDGDKVTVEGNSCPRGEEYGRKEVTAPTRTVTGSVRVSGGETPLVSVKTVPDVPKDMIFKVMEVIRSATVDAPINTGDILISDAAGTGSDIVATKTVQKL